MAKKSEKKAASTKPSKKSGTSDPAKSSGTSKKEESAPKPKRSPTMGYGYMVYFTERPKNRVICWDPDSGEAKVVAGEPKDGDPSQKLKDPYGLAMDGQGHLLIADKLNHRICRLNGKLTTVAMKDMDGHRSERELGRAAAPRPYCPTGVYAEAGKSIVCAFSDDNTIYRIHGNGKLERLLGVTPNHRILRSGLVRAVEPRDLGQALLWIPTAVTEGADGTIYFIERGYQWIRMFNPKVGLQALFLSVKEVDVPDVSDAPAQGKIKDFHLLFPSALALDSAGALFVADAYRACVLKLNVGKGTFETVLQLKRRPELAGGPAGLAFGPDETAWVVDSLNGKVQAYKTGGAGRWEEAPVRLTKVNNVPLHFKAVGAGVACGQ